MKITMIGTGYVGLVSGICFSDFGHDVVCVDKDASKIDALKDGEVPIYEPGLKELMAKNVGAGRLTFTLDLRDAITDADAVFIAVGTPTRRGDGHADLSYVYAAAEEIAQTAHDYIVVVTKSTVPVGTNRQVKQIIRKTNPELQFDVASNPEFLREGAAIEDFMRPDRVVIGVQNDRAQSVMEDIYRPLHLRDYPIVSTDLESAELIKYAANAFLATKITFMNEMAALCERVGANVKEVANGIGLDNRIGQENAVPMQITETVIKVNEDTKRRMIDRLQDSVGGSFHDKTIAVMGVTFKPDTDDMRDAPSLTIIPALIGGGANVRVCDPQGIHEGEALLPNVDWIEDPYKAAQGADLVVILTEWNEFRALNLKKLVRRMAVPRMADLRNIFSTKDAKRAGFETYVSIGRPDYNS